MTSPNIETLRELVAPSLRHARVDLVEMQWSRGILRLVIDKPGGVTLDDCERVSTAVSATLDAYDPIAPRYSLEVSSPGAERPLRTPQDWLAAIGMNVRVRYKSGESEMNVEGRLVETSASSATLELKQRTRTRLHTVDLGDVIAARIAVAI